jgi:hypothetical protein
MALTLLASLLGCKFHHVPPIYVGYYNGGIYYVMLCIDSNRSQEQQFILGSTNILLAMESANSMWMRLEG